MTFLGSVAHVTGAGDFVLVVFRSESRSLFKNGGGPKQHGGRLKEEII